MTFSSLKKNQASRLEQYATQAAKQSGGEKEADSRFWKPTRDKAGNGYAVIRFLPAREGETTPWATWYDHGFQGPTGQWYFEKSLTTIGKDDPVSELNSRLWKESTDDSSPGRKQARVQKRRTHYTSSILVIEDGGNPENNGKIFLYTYGKKIFEKLQDAMRPQFQDEQPFNPFDFWGGANFRLKVRNVEGYPNYDKSEFDKPSALFDGDDVKLEQLYEKIYSLKEFTDPKTFKTYEELRHKLARVLGVTTAQTTVAVQEDDFEVPDQAPAEPTRTARPEAKVVDVDAEVDESDPVSYFQELANKARRNMDA